MRAEGRASWRLPSSHPLSHPEAPLSIQREASNSGAASLDWAGFKVRSQFHLECRREISASAGHEGDR